MFKLFGREQVVYLGVIAAVFQVLMAYNVGVSGKVQGILTAVVVFVFAVGNAIKVHQGAAALALGLFNAVVALLAAFSLHMDDTTQAKWVGLITILVAAFTRQVVVNPEPDPSPAGKLVGPSPQA